MTQESPGSDNRADAPKRRNKHLGKRPAKRRPKARNALYALAVEFKSRHPQATAAAAWAHFVAVAGIGCSDVVLRHDAARDALKYLPDPDRRGTRTVTRRGFEQQWYRLRNE